MRWCAMKNHTAPILAAALLLLQILYIGSYFALVLPNPLEQALADVSGTYRFGGPFAEAFFWPVQRVDQELRPHTWRWKRLSEQGRRMVR